MSAADAVARDDLLARRRRALEETGWGLPFRLVQPHDVCWWLYAVLVGIGLVRLVGYFSQGASVVGAGLAAGAVATAAYGLVFVLLLRRGDHYERQPRSLVLAAFVWGAVPATFLFALTANTALLSLYPKLLGQAFAADWAPALIAPFTEESSKAAGFVLLLALAPRLVRTPYDAVFLGAFIGLGFQLFEDVLYDYNSAIAGFGADQVGAVLGTFGLRAVSGIFSHTLYSALCCCGVLFLVGTPLQPRRIGAGIGLILLAMVAHGTWDAIGALAGTTAFGFLGVIAFSTFALVVLFRVLRWTGGTERDELRAVLAPEVADGTLAPEELDAVCAPRKQRRAYLRAGHGHGSRRRREHVLHASFDLAHELALSGGEDSPGVEHERAEIARLRGGPAELRRSGGGSTR